jgi:GNAT superfamily N-acetyltransferase/predicted CoA-binding protein
MTVAAVSSYALLADGRTVEIRAAGPDDCADVCQMHTQMSPDNAYLRFFSLSALAPEREAERLCRPAGPDHAALLARLGGELVGVASYEPTTRPGVAEVAFAVRDDMHGRGVATLLLEHLVSLARQRGLTAFAGETLPENTEMQKVFADAGLPVERHYAAGAIDVTIPLPSHEGVQLDHYLDAVAGRFSRSDGASLAHVLRPASVAVIGAGRRRGSVGREILHNIVKGGFEGPVYAVNPRGHSMEGLACLSHADQLPVGTELAVLAVPATEVPTVAAQCGERGVRALVVITSGLGPAGADLPPVRHAAGRPELLRPGHERAAAERHVCGGRAAGRHGRPRRAVRRRGHRRARAPRPAGHRRLVVRLGRRQVRRVQQRHAHLVGAG